MSKITKSVLLLFVLVVGLTFGAEPTNGMAHSRDNAAITASYNLFKIEQVGTLLAVWAKAKDANTTHYLVKVTVANNDETSTITRLVKRADSLSDWLSTYVLIPLSSPIEETRISFLSVTPIVSPEGAAAIFDSTGQP